MLALFRKIEIIPLRLLTHGAPSAKTGGALDNNFGFVSPIQNLAA